MSELDLTVADGEMFAIVGPSGCGKTTVLRMVAGLLAPDGGSIHFGDRDVTALAPERRHAAMVFQNYALFPHLDVGDNVGFGLRPRKLGKADIVARVERALAMVGLGGHLRREVGSLSGGEQQRVALARAIVVEPQLLLLDEPMSNLDQKLREGTRADLRALQRKLGITTLYVTHDQQEALEIADRVAVFDRGAIAQIGTPREVYDRPTSEFVASFLGRANAMDATVVAREAAFAVLDLAGGGRVNANLERSVSGDAVRLIVRPESLRVVGGPGDERLGEALVEGVDFQGATMVARLDLNGVGWRMVTLRDDAQSLVPGERVTLWAPRDRLVVLPVRDLG